MTDGLGMDFDFEALQPVVVIWRDAAQIFDSWSDLREVELSSTIIVTCGFLVPNTGDHVLILQSTDGDDNGDSGISIPLELVYEIRNLGTPIKGSRLTKKWTK